MTGNRLVLSISIGMLVIQGALFALSIPRNSVTFDEVQHLPAGISYWHHGRFFSYQHNPPFTKLLFALPAVLSNVPVDYHHYYYEPGSRRTDALLADDFMRKNRQQYHRVFCEARAVCAALAVVGGWIVFVWSRELFGPVPGLISQSLWTCCPMVLAHGGLVTPDIGATVIGLIATYLFWKHLCDPRPFRVVLAAIGLGLAIASKFTLIVLPIIWFALALMAFTLHRVQGTQSWTFRIFALDALVMTLVSLITLNTVYLFEGSGMPLGRMKLFSKALTKPADPSDLVGSRVSRFSGEAWKWIPTPLPQHFVLGIDQQMYDTRPGEAFLRGELRYGRGWLYYYFYAFTVKTPLGTLCLLLASICFCLLGARGVKRRSHSQESSAETLGRRQCTSSLSQTIGVACLLLPIIAILTMLSSNTLLNKHSRYMLQAYPLLFVLIGGAIQFGQSIVGKAADGIAVVAICVNVLSVLSVHPYYLTYFNEVAGGPRSGCKHLIDSNIDWGQGLVALGQWIDAHRLDGDIQLAYFGAVDPAVYGISFSVPGVLEESTLGGPRPGIHVISVNYVAGSSIGVMTSSGRQRIPLQGYRFYQQLVPVDTIANCFNVYRVSVEEANELRMTAGLPPL